MFCPECETEYRPGIQRCADCGASLGPELPRLPRKEYPEPVLLLSSRDREMMSVLRAVLRNSGIECWLVGDMPYRLASSVVQVYVREEHLARAREVVTSLAEPTELSPAPAPQGSGNEATPEE